MFEWNCATVFDIRVQDVSLSFSLGRLYLRFELHVCQFRKTFPSLKLSNIQQVLKLMNFIFSFLTAFSC